MTTYNIKTEGDLTAVTIGDRNSATITLTTEGWKQIAAEILGEPLDLIEIAIYNHKAGNEKTDGDTVEDNNVRGY